MGPHFNARRGDVYGNLACKFGSCFPRFYERGYELLPLARAHLGRSFTCARCRMTRERLDQAWGDTKAVLEQRI